ncbi:hypothetical protein MMC30_009003 [Trapelia coarctata]|nr:hypothetical protein [Trapelia coarctata]
MPSSYLILVFSLLLSLVTAGNFVIDWGADALPPKWSAGGNYGWDHKASWQNTHHQGDVLFCRISDLSPKVPTPAECLRAIEMIPSGPEVDPDYMERIGRPNPAKPIAFKYDKRKYAMPASFRSGDCVIHIWADRRSKTRPPEELHVSLMHHYIWPTAKAAAKDVVRLCVAEPTQHVEGGYEMYGRMQQNTMRMAVRVRYVKRGMQVKKDYDMQSIDDQPGNSNVYNARKAKDWDPDWPRKDRFHMTLRGRRRP